MSSTAPAPSSSGDNFIPPPTPPPSLSPAPTPEPANPVSSSPPSPPPAGAPSASTTESPSPPSPASFSIPSLPSPSTPSSSGPKSLAVGLSVGGVVVLLLLLGIAGIYWFKKKKRQTPPESDKGGAPPSPSDPSANRDHHVVKISPSPLSPNVPFGSPRSSTFTYKELEMATDGFSDANHLGRGGFGDVHKGVLADGKEVAVKQLRAGSYQGDREFQSEVEVISRVNHKHLVSLVGYCVSGDSRLLVYEFIPNNTLEYHLHGKEGPALDWPTRLKIAIGSGKGLEYLHEGCRPKIIHRDIKAANILLDEKFEAMVADFGLAKIASDNNTHVSTRVMGTFGYLAPEYASSGKLTDKSDVFSYGVMLLELITGRRPCDTSQLSMHDSLVDWARPLLARASSDGNYDSFVDPKLNKEYDRKEMGRMIACTAACLRHSARRRPRMSLGEVSLDDLNDGMKPGHSEIYSLQDAPDYDSQKYDQLMKNMKERGLGGTGEYASSEAPSTNEYAINPSMSSNEGRHIEEMRHRSVEGR